MKEWSLSRVKQLTWLSLFGYDVDGTLSFWWAAVAHSQ
jgi:hypothetical protein